MQMLERFIYLAKATDWRDIRAAFCQRSCRYYHESGGECEVCPVDTHEHWNLFIEELESLRKGGSDAIHQDD